MPHGSGTPTTRFGLKTVIGNDSPDGATQITDVATGVDAIIKGWAQGTYASRPAAGTAGREYFATDIGVSFNDDGATWRPVAAQNGKTNIATIESRSNTSFGTLTTPDQVSVILPTDGLLTILYQATWQNSVGAAGAAAIFLGANQLTLASQIGLGPTQISAGCTTTANLYVPLSSSAIGLGPNTPIQSTGGNYAGDSTTGQLVGVYDGNTEYGGPCCIFAAAGTYTVSVQFKSTSGSVTVKNRKLWVNTQAFGS